MSAEIVDVNGNLLTMKVSGKLSQPELASLQEEAAAILVTLEQWRILVLAEKFAGWEKGGKWDDFSFQLEHDSRIERMAIVGERTWEETVLIFTAKGLRKFPIEYFEPTQLARARAWLAAN